MPGTVIERLKCIRAGLTCNSYVRRVNMLDGIRSAFAWYGVHRRHIARQMKVMPIDDTFNWVDFGVYGLTWPAASPISSLVTAMVELWVDSNPHFYFSPLTEVRAGDCVLDVGACEGAFALECLFKYKAASVFCFEPDSRMAIALKITVERNGVEKEMHVVQAAVSNTSGRAPFIENLDNPLMSRLDLPMNQSGLSQVVNMVTQITLDDWAEQAPIQQVDYIKIDAEGSDLSVLQGAQNCLERWRPAIAVTTYHHPEHCNQIAKYLLSLSLGYRLEVRGLVSFDAVPRPIMLHAACDRSK